jgi:hypothetical protein
MEARMYSDSLIRRLKVMRGLAPCTTAALIGNVSQSYGGVRNFMSEARVQGLIGRVSHGVYDLTDAGRDAVKRSDALASIAESLGDMDLETVSKAADAVAAVAEVSK